MSEVVKDLLLFWCLANQLISNAGGFSSVQEGYPLSLLGSGLNQIISKTDCLSYSLFAYLQR